MNPVSPVNWVSISKKYHLTITDVLNLPDGESVKIFFMDRNVFDSSCDEKNNPVGKPVKPSVFFRNKYFIQFTKIEGIVGVWKWLGDWADELESKKEEFHIKIPGGYWYPLKNNELPLEDNLELFDFGNWGGLHYSKFPPDTKLGWRGPMMLAEDMDKCPDIVMKESGYIN